MPNADRGSESSTLTIAFHVEGKPIQQGSMRAYNNHIVHAKSVELKAWRLKVGQAARIAGCTPIDGKIAISLAFTYLKPRTSRREHPTVPPDLDKQIRSILDALTGVAYVDDSQVIEIHATKAYGAVQGVYIQVTGGFEDL